MYIFIEKSMLVPLSCESSAGQRANNAPNQGVLELALAEEVAGKEIPTDTLGGFRRAGNRLSFFDVFGGRGEEERREREKLQTWISSLGTRMSQGRGFELRGLRARS